MLATPSSPGGWDSFAQTQGPPQDLGYTPGISSDAGPSTSPFTSDDDDDDIDQYIGDDDSQ